MKVGGHRVSATAARSTPGTMCPGRRMLRWRPHRPKAVQGAVDVGFRLVPMSDSGPSGHRPKRGEGARVANEWTRFRMSRHRRAGGMRGAKESSFQHSRPSCGVPPAIHRRQRQPRTHPYRAARNRPASPEETSVRQRQATLRMHPRLLSRHSHPNPTSAGRRPESRSPGSGGLGYGTSSHDARTANSSACRFCSSRRSASFDKFK